MLRNLVLNLGAGADLEVSEVDLSPHIIIILTVHLFYMLLWADLIAPPAVHDFQAVLAEFRQNEFVRALGAVVMCN